MEAAKRGSESLSWGRRIAKYLVCICLIFSLVFSWICGFMQYNVLDAESFKNKIVDEAYIDATMADIRDELEFECLYLSLPIEEVMAGIDRYEVKKLADQYVVNAVNNIVYNEEMVNQAYAPELLEPTLLKIMNAKNLQESEDEINRHVQELSDYVSAYISNSINIVNADHMNSLPKLGLYKDLARLFVNLFFLFLALDVILFVCLFLLNKKRVVAWLFNFFASFWIATTLVFVPIMVIKWENIAAKLFLAEDSLLKMLVDHILNGFIQALFTPALLVFILASVGLLATLFFLIRPKKDQLANQRGYRLAASDDGSFGNPPDAP